MSSPGRFDFDGSVQRINAQNRAEDARAAARRKLAIEDGRRLAAAFREMDGSIRAIWGFGSTFEAYRPYRMDSDIDLAVEGGNILKLYSIAEGSEFKVDLVDISDAVDGFAAAIRKNGHLL